MLDTFLSAKDTTVNKSSRVLALKELTIMGDRHLNKSL